MLNPKIKLEKNRFEELLSTITDARKSLQDWQDKRTEALIQFDAISYDIKQVEEDKKRAEDLVIAMKGEVEDREKAYQKSVESMTDQMQMLKVEKEESERQLNEIIDRLNKQVIDQEVQQAREREQEAERIASFERRLEEQYQRNREQVEGLNFEINALLEKIEVLKTQVTDAEVRGDRNERELHAFRSQMMSFLKVTQAEKMPEIFKQPTSAPAPVSKRVERRPVNPQIVRNSEALDLASKGYNQNGQPIAAPTAQAQESSIESFVVAGGVTAELNCDSTVEDYLKRLGY